MKKKLTVLFLSLFTFTHIIIPGIIYAGGKKSSDLVVVADIRLVTNQILHYFADVYNTNSLLLAIWAVVLTAVYGCFLGILMDIIMSRTGIDLKSRKIIEH